MKTYPNSNLELGTGLGLIIGLYLEGPAVAGQLPSCSSVGRSFIRIE